VEEADRVVAVVDEEEDSFAAGGDGEAEQRAGAGLPIQGLGEELLSGGCDFDDVSVAGVRRENVSVGSERESERLDQVAAFRDRRSAAYRSSCAGQGVEYRGITFASVSAM
jgi:hypothetical protein